jgi:deoxyadenosine/deoxycytidine kinase
VITWVNGPFGGGKSAVTTELLTRIPNSLFFDPEAVGSMLRPILPGREPDFQDLPPWRPLVAATAIELIAYTGQPLIAPMSLLRHDYAKEIFTALEAHGIPVHHVVLHTDRDTLLQRIHNDRTHSEGAKAFRLSKVDAYYEAVQTWLAGSAPIIDTTHINPSQVADRIVASIPAPQ